MNGLLLALLYLGAVLTPLGLAFARVRPPRSIWDELASGAGMLAFAIILVEFLLSGRFRVISGGVGMDVTMRLHQLLARAALVLAMMHPFFYVTPFGPQLPYDPTREFTLVEPGMALVTGAIAWVLLPAFVLISISHAEAFKTYEAWRWGHGIGAALIAGLTWHHTIHAGRYAQDPVLETIWAGLLAIALFSLVSVYFIRPLQRLRKPWHVTVVEKVADRTWAVDLNPVGHSGLDYKAGQFSWVNIGHNAFCLSENPFSIASAPAEKGRLRFLIKELGDFTSTLASIRSGTTAYVDGPHGTLTIDGHPAPGLGLIAGGVGVAPMLSILRQKDAVGDDRPTRLIYGNRHPGQIVAESELNSFAEAGDTSIVHVVSEPSSDWSGSVGMIDAQLIEKHFGEPAHKTWLYVLCGPLAMMTGVEKTLVALGVPPGNILSERFTYG